MDGLEKDLDKKIDAAEAEAVNRVVEETSAQMHPEDDEKNIENEAESTESEKESTEQKDTDSSDNEEADKTDDKSDDKAEEKSGKVVFEDKPSKGNKFFKKKKDKKDEKIEELTDRLQRQMAEFDNFRKRTEKEKASMFDYGAKDVIEKLLPIVDNFERGFDAAKEKEGDSFVDGMQKIYKQLITMLTDLGVEVIEAAGKEFDPNLHNAVMHVEDEDAGDNIVVEEFQKGYTYKGTVVRHSMVKVAN